MPTLANDQVLLECDNGHACVVTRSQLDGFRAIPACSKCGLQLYRPMMWNGRLRRQWHIDHVGEEKMAETAEVREAVERLGRTLGRPLTLPLSNDVRTILTAYAAAQTRIEELEKALKGSLTVTTTMSIDQALLEHAPLHQQFIAASLAKNLAGELLKQPYWFKETKAYIQDGREVHEVSFTLVPQDARAALAKTVTLTATPAL